VQSTSIQLRFQPRRSIPALTQTLGEIDGNAGNGTFCAIVVPPVAGGETDGRALYSRRRYPAFNGHHGRATPPADELPLGRGAPLAKQHGLLDSLVLRVKIGSIIPRLNRHAAGMFSCGPFQSVQGCSTLNHSRITEGDRVLCGRLPASKE
jgi:hypothetical protein